LRWAARVALAGSLIAIVLHVTAPAGHSVCGAGSSNPIVIENCKQGTPPSEWDISGAGEDTIQGFATDISVNRGQAVQFKVDTVANSYKLDIYRMGYYQGNGARLVTTVQPTDVRQQPACQQDAGTGRVDCSNWTVSATWNVPSDAVSGIYFAAAVRTDGTAGASHIFFIVRDDASHSDIYYQTSDTTWQAYNRYGGHGLYFGGPRQDPGQPDRATKASYNRPFTTRDYASEDWVFNAEYPMVRWLERNGYDVSYETGVDTDRFGSLIRNHKLFMSSGHDEYWSGQQRANLTAARDAGVNLAFFSGNEVFWKTRWEDNYRTLVTYKETHANPGTAETQRIDPTGIWTGTWMDPRFNTEHRTPQNALTGTLFTVTAGSNSMKVPAEYGALRFWRNTSVSHLGAGQTATLGGGDTVGYEWDSDIDNGFRPPGLFDLSATTFVGTRLQDYGSNYSDEQATHNMTLYRAASGALVFGAGTVQWAWGLDGNHDRGSAAPDPDMQQATVNLFADMHVQPATLSGPTPATASTDTIAPQSTITSPVPSTVTAGQTVTINGTAADTGGGHVAGVEVSVDGGATWHPAVGRESWTYIWIPTASGHPTVLSRAVDDSGNLGPPPPGNGSSSGGSGGSGSSGTSAAGPKATTAKGAARLTLSSRTIRASKAGTVKLRIACPRGKGSCRVALRLALGKRVLAKKSLTVRAGASRSVALTLTRSARRDLARKHSLHVTAIAVTSRGGKHTTTRTSVLLLPPRKP
jgi:hypothetical protein